MLIRPWRIVADITSIDPEELKACGIRGLIFDLDNTLMAPHTGVLEARMEAWLTRVHDAGLGCVVVSNNKKAHYVEMAQNLLGFPCIANGAKPSRKFLRQGLEILKLDAKEVAVVGDRPLTDIWGGNRLGAYTILVDPLTKLTEPTYIKFLRGLERACVWPF